MAAPKNAQLLQPSRLLHSVSPQGIRTLARVAVMHGVVCQIDGTDASDRVVLPLHLEVFQALLLQRLQAQDRQCQVRSAHTDNHGRIGTCEVHAHLHTC